MKASIVNSLLLSILLVGCQNKEGKKTERANNKRIKNSDGPLYWW
jgi:uncharacterized lipoprotein NlpE involved in copper resistance